MRPRFTSRLLAVLALVGLIAGPFAAPVSLAAPEQTAFEAADHSSMHMPDGVPCCPETQGKSDCSKDCPFMTVCAGVVFPPTNGVTFRVPIASLAVIAPADDAKLHGCAQGPPARPPKA